MAGFCLSTLIRIMAQIKIYGLRSALSPIRTKLSETIHHCVVDVLKIPPDKRFHRFILLDQEDFIYPEDRSEHYLIIEVLMMSGRSIDTKKQLIRRLFQEISEQLGIAPTDIEICILESPPSHWGFRGMTGDEITLNYSLDV